MVSLNKYVGCLRDLMKALDFLPKTSWKGEKPAKFCWLFSVLSAQLKAISREQWVSLIILLIIWLIILLINFITNIVECLIIASNSTATPGDPAAVVLMWIPIYLLISMKSLFAHSPPLSAKILSNESYTDIHRQKIVITTVSLLLLSTHAY